MAIIHMMGNRQYNFSTKQMEIVTEFPEGAYCMLENGRENTFESAIILYSTHHGLCLFEREANYYDDSDFYMTIWNPEKECAEEFQFATTRGWTYPCFASKADATPEVLQAYNAWKTAQERRSRILYKMRVRNARKVARAKASITLAQYNKLRNVCTVEMFTACMDLLSRNLRSAFRKALCKQLREWLENPSPKYPTPFSQKQMAYL